MEVESNKYVVIHNDVHIPKLEIQEPFKINGIYDLCIYDLREQLIPDSTLSDYSINIIRCTYFFVHLRINPEDT